MTNRKRGISIAITEVILVAVTIAFIFLAINWLWGLWHVEQEAFMINPILFVKATGTSGEQLILNLYIINEGGKAVTILKVEVEASGGSFLNKTNLIVEPGARLDIEISDWIWVGEGEPPTIIPGDRYRVKIYTDRYGVYIADVVASG